MAGKWTAAGLKSMMCGSCISRLLWFCISTTQLIRSNIYNLWKHCKQQWKQANILILAHLIPWLIVWTIQQTTTLQFRSFAAYSVSQDWNTAARFRSELHSCISGFCQFRNFSLQRVQWVKIRNCSVVVCWTFGSGEGI